jgi:hypothetical protein
MDCPNLKPNFFNKVLLPCYAKKTKPDFKENDKGKRIEEAKQLQLGNCVIILKKLMKNQYQLTI